MAQLHADSERFSFEAELSFGELFGQGVPFILLLAGDGEASDSPPQASVAGGLLGLANEQTRVIGDTVYRLRPAAAEIDGGRPWVRGKRSAREGATGLDPSGILESDQAGRQGTFSKLIEQINGALAIKESGPVTVDDQRVTEYDAALDPAPFLAKLKSQSPEPRHPLGSLFETSPVGGPKAPAKSAPPPTFELELFIAPNGLPVRARFTFAAEGATVAVRVDTLAINIPVHVAPPPRDRRSAKRGSSGWSGGVLGSNCGAPCAPAVACTASARSSAGGSLMQEPGSPGWKSRHSDRRVPRGFRRAIEARLRQSEQ